MRYLRLTCLILIGFMASGCATAWVVAEARKPGHGDIDAWVDYEAEDATVVWKRWLALPIVGGTPWPAHDVDGNPLTTGITRKLVLKPEAGSSCEKITVCIGCHAPINNPCGVSVRYMMLEKAETYGFLVQKENKPDQEIPIKGHPYVWLLLPIGVGIDAGVVAAMGLVCVGGGLAGVNCLDIPQ